MANEQFSTALQLYTINPYLFKDEDVDLLEKQAKQLGVPFRRNQSTFDSNLFNHAKQFFQGIFAGFTTFSWGEDPTSTSQALLRNIGHLIGFAPGILAGPAILGGKLAGAVGARAAVKAFQLGKAASIGVGKYSVPMFMGHLAVKKIGALAQSSAALSSLKFLGAGTVGRSMVKGGLHLGVASAVSSWRGGIDEAMSSFAHGAAAGAMFGGMANWIKLERWLKSADPKKVNVANQVTRGLAGGLYLGLPTTLADHPLEIQVYQYLLGAYFGGTALPVDKQTALKHLAVAGKKGNEYLMQPETREEFRALNRDKVPEFATNIQAEQEAAKRKYYGPVRALQLANKKWIPLNSAQGEVIYQARLFAGKMATPEFSEQAVVLAQELKKAGYQVEPEDVIRKATATAIEQVKIRAEVEAEPVTKVSESVKETPAKTEQPNRLKRGGVKRRGVKRRGVKTVSLTASGLFSDNIKPGHIQQVSIDGITVTGLVTKVDKNGKVLEAIELQSGRFIYKNGKIQTQLWKQDVKSVSEIQKIFDVAVGVESPAKTEQPKAEESYEVSSKGDKRFSALYAKLKDGRTIEQAWAEAKGYKNTKEAKNKPAKKKGFKYWETYKGLWQQWAKENPALIEELRVASKGKVLTDVFAKTENNQARALSEILAESKPAEVEQPKVEIAKNTVAEGLQKLFTAKKEKIESQEVRTPYGIISVKIKLSDVEKAYWDGKRLVTKADKDLDLAGLKEAASRTHLGEFETLENKKIYDNRRREWLILEDLAVKIDFLTKENKIVFSKLDPGSEKAETFDMIYGAVEAVQKKLGLSFDTKITVKTNFKYKKPFNKISDILGKDPAEQPKVVHSGAAKGADTVFQLEAEKRGIPVKAHSFKGHEKGNKARVEHTPEELKKADSHLIKANETLKRKFPTSNQFVNNLLRRNYFQVKDSDQIIAVSRIENGQVKGGTAWATQMGIDMGKPVFVFDMNTNRWHKWDGSKYSVSDAPTLSKSVAGIGSRAITKKGKQAVEDLFETEQPKPVEDVIISKDERRHIESLKEYVSSEKYGLPEKTKDTVLHGTQEAKVQVDKLGNLVLLPSENFGGKMYGVSFTELRDVAKFYGEHRGGETRKVVPGTVIIEIDKAALPELKKESVEELFVGTKEPLLVPRNEYRIHKSTLEPKLEAELKEWERKTIVETKALSDNELVKRFVYSEEAGEIAESRGMVEETPYKISPGVSELIVEKYGHISPDTFYVWQEIVNRAKADPSKIEKFSLLSRSDLYGAEIITPKELDKAMEVKGKQKQLELFRREVEVTPVAISETVRDAIDAHEIPMIHRPIDFFADKIAEIKNLPRDKVALDVQAVADKHFKEAGEPGFEDFLQEVGNKYKISIEPERADLRRYWKNRVYEQKLDQIYFTGEKTQTSGQVDLKYNRIVRYKRPNIIERLLGIKGKSLFTYESFSDLEGIPFVDNILDINLADKALAKIFISENDKNRGYVGGSKDKNVMYFFPYRVNKAEANEVLAGYLDKLSVIDKQTDRNYDKLLTKFRKMMASHPIPKEGVDQMYARMVASNYRMLEEINQLPIETILDPKNKSKFITDPVQFNKRLQLLQAGEPGLDRSYYEGMPGFDGNFKAIIVNALPGKGGVTQSVVGKNLFKIKMYDEKGRIVTVILDSHLDGVVSTRQDVFDRMLEDGGLPGEAGVAKGVITHPEKGKGLLLSKLAYFRVGNKENAEMLSIGDDGIHFKLYDTSVKQSGLREKFDQQLKKSGDHAYYKEGTKKQQGLLVYDIAPENATINLGTFEDVASQIKDQPLMRQVLTNLTPLQMPQKVIDQAKIDIVDKSVQGDLKINLKVAKFIETGDESGVKNITGYDIDKISVINILKILAGNRVVDSTLYRNIWKHLLGLDRRGELNLEELSLNELDPQEAIEIQKQLKEFTGAAQRILRNWETNPFTINFKLTWKYTDAVLRNYIINRYIRPRMPYSGKAIGVPYDLYLQQRIDLKPGDFYLGDAWKKKVLSFLGQDRELGDMWVEYQKALKDKRVGKEKIAQMEEDFRIAIGRVPASSISGTRILRFKGFTGRRGAGILLHPEDMLNLDGMDLDIDSVFLYQSLSKGLKDAIYANRNEWYKNGVFMPPKRLKGQLGIKDLDATSKSVVGLADPLVRYRASLGAREGNQLLGLANNLRRRLLVYYSTIADKKYVSYRYIDSDGKDVSVSYPVAKDGGASLRLYAREASSFFADAGDYAAFPNNIQLSNILFSRLFKGVTPSLKAQQLFIGEAQRADALLAGKDYERNRTFSLREIIEELKILSGGLEKHPNIWNKIAVDIGQLDISTNPRNFINYKNAMKTLRIFSHVFNDPKNEAAQYVRSLVLRRAIVTGQDRKVAADPEEAYSQNKEFFSQDLADWATSLAVFEAADKFIKAGGTVEVLDDIATVAESFKQEYNYRIAGRINFLMEGQYKPKYTTINQIERAVAEYVSTLPEEAQSFFHRYLMGSLYKQDLELKEYTGSLKEQIQTEKNHYDKTKLIEQFDSIVKDWHRTDLTQLGYILASTPEAEIRAMGKYFNDLYTQTQQKPNEKVVRQILGIESTGVKEVDKAIEEAGKVNEAVTLNDPEYNSFMKQIDEIAATDIKETKEIAHLRKKLQFYFQRRPEVVQDFQKFYEGFQLNFRGIGVIPELASLDDLRGLVDYFQDVTLGTYLSKVAKKGVVYKLRGWHYMMFPQTISKKMLPYDFNLFPLKNVIVKAKQGKTFTKNVLIPFSHFGRLEALGLEAINQADSTINKMLIDMKTRFQFLDKIGEDGDELFAIAWAFKERPRQHREGGSLIYETEYQKYLKIFNERYKNKTYSALDAEGNVTRTPASEVLTKINTTITQLMTEIYTKWIRSDDAISPYIVRRKSGLIDYDKTITKVGDALYQGKDIPIVSLNELFKLRFGMLQSEGKIKQFDDEGNPVKHKDIGQILFHEYLPHSGHPKKALKEHLTRQLSILQEKGASPEELARKRMQIESIIGEKLQEDGGMAIETAEMLTETRMQETGLHHRPGHVLGRNTDGGPIPGWAKTRTAIEDYQTQIIKGYYNNLFGLMAYRIIGNFERVSPFKVVIEEGKKIDYQETTRWARFMRLYARRVLGYPSYFPAHWLEKNDIRVKHTPYYWMSDHAALKGANKISKKFFGGKKFWVNDLDFGRKMAHFSNLEAKWELMSLLAHTKAMANNLLGGTMNTIISTGYRNWRNARSLKFLQNEINHEWDSWDKINAWAETHGAVESFIVTEANLSRKFAGIKAKRFLERASKARKKDPDMDDKTLYEIAKEVGLSKQWVDAAAWFMRKSERILRRDAFISHYLQARQTFEANNVVFELDHPWLIQMAKKGVENTQYYYNNAARPAFAATSLGKIFARFQLWAWNSIRFRKDIYQSAKHYGFKPGTKEFDKFKRWILGDALILTLASAFPMSMFDSVIPPPWSYMKDMAELMFGDEQERARAFFGTYPTKMAWLQAISPPSMRVLAVPITSLMANDWSKFASYHVWTWFPFGRMARDIKRTIETPAMGIENATGFPVHQIGRYLRVEREKKMIRPISPMLDFGGKK